MARSPNQDLAELNLPSAIDPARPKGDQIRQILESLAAALGSGAALPSERSLAERFGVARMTIRNELRALALDGVLTLRRGAGAFVSEEPLPPRSVGASFSREIRMRGMRPGAIVVEHTRLQSTSRLAARLEVAEGAPVLRLVRARTADGEILGVESTSVPLDRFPGLDDLDFTDRSLYDTFRDLFQVEAVKVKATATARRATETEAELMKISPALPCMAIDSLQRDAFDRVIEAGNAIYRGDRYNLDVSYVRT